MKTITNIISYHGTFRGKTFDVLYRRTNELGTWQATARLFEELSQPPREQMEVHKGRAPCMTDAMRLMVRLFGKTPRKMECDCRRTKCLVCSARRKGAANRAIAKSIGLKVVR